MKRIIVNNTLILDNVEKHTGAVFEIYTAKIRINGQKPINVTYDCKKDNLIIHEWYNINSAALGVVTELLKACFARLIVEDEVYPAAVAAMDRYNKAIGMEFPESYIEGLEFNMNYLLKKIESAGLMEEFTEYALA